MNILKPPAMLPGKMGTTALHTDSEDYWLPGSSGICLKNCFLDRNPVWTFRDNLVRHGRCNCIGNTLARTAFLHTTAYNPTLICLDFHFKKFCFFASIRYIRFNAIRAYLIFWKINQFLFLFREDDDWPLAVVVDSSRDLKDETLTSTHT